MMKINTHGLKMEGLADAAKETRFITPTNDCTVQIAYDRTTGEIRYNAHWDYNSYTAHNDPDIITLFHAGKRYTQQQLADKIFHRIAEIDAEEAWMEKQMRNMPDSRTF